MRLATLLVLVSSGVLAQEEHPATPAVETMDVSGDVRAQANDWMIMPAGNYTVGGTLSFMTADSTLAGGMGKLKFTDVVLLGVNGGFSIKGRAEVFGGATFFPKQPASAD